MQAIGNKTSDRESMSFRVLTGGPDSFDDIPSLSVKPRVISPNNTNNVKYATLHCMPLYCMATVPVEGGGEQDGTSEEVCGRNRWRGGSGLAASIFYWMRPCQTGQHHGGRSAHRCLRRKASHFCPSWTG